MIDSCGKKLRLREDERQVKTNISVDNNNNKLLWILVDVHITNLPHSNNFH